MASLRRLFAILVNEATPKLRVNWGQSYGPPVLNRVPRRVRATDSTGLLVGAEGIEFATQQSRSRERNAVAPPPLLNWSLLESGSFFCLLTAKGGNLPISNLLFAAHLSGLFGDSLQSLLPGDFTHMADCRVG
jgi:hypothetical protein